MKDSEVNSTSLVPASKVYDGNNGKPVKVVYTIIYPDGSSDDVQYSDINKATKALLEIDEVKDKCVAEYIANRTRAPSDEDREDYCWDVAIEIGEELGYRLNPILK